MQVDPGPAAGRDALAADQRAVLDLLLTRGLGLEEIARVTGLPADGVQARAGAAVGALGGGALDDDVTALLLGTAGPAERRDAARALRRDADARAGAVRAAAALEAGWPGYVPPTLAGGGGSGRGWRVWAAAGAVAAAAVVGVLLLTGVLGGDDDGAPRTAARPAIPAPVRVTMQPPRAGSSASGRATIGVTASFRPYMQLDLSGLPAPPRGVVYLLWADDGTGHGYPLPTPITAPDGGEFHQRYALSTALAPLLRVSRSLDLVAVDASRLATLSDQVSAAGRAGPNATLPTRPGVVVLRGRIP